MSHEHQPPDPIFIAEVTVAADATDSSILDTNGYVPVAIRTPAALTSTSLTFKAGTGASDLLAMRDTSGNALSATVAASGHIPLSPSNFAGVHRLQLIMGSAEAAGRTITIILRKLGMS